jgi:hypothetical protein
MNDICAIIGHSPAMFGICSVCGTQTEIWPVPTKRINREEAQEMYPKTEDSTPQPKGVE